MLLCELTIGGSVRRVSNEELSLEHSWYAELSSALEVKYATSSACGGFVKPSFGGFASIPTTFIETLWPPPITVPAVFKYTETTEAEAITLLDTTCHLAGTGRTEIPYDVKHKDNETKISARTLSGTLVALFTTYCGGAYLNLTLNSSKARSPSPTLQYVVEGDEGVLTLDVLNILAEYSSHLFYIEGNVLHLVDMLQDNGVVVLDEFDFSPVEYGSVVPYKSFTAGDFKIDGSYPYSDSDFGVSAACNTAKASVLAALAVVKSVIEKPTIVIPMPMTLKACSLKPGMKLSWTDESLGKPVSAWLRVRSINYDYNGFKVTVEGEGGISA